jgi:uncharacterized phiE125 gp8 family phage protein
MALKIITEPTQEPITLAQAKEHLRVDGTDEDDVISNLILTARKYCETYQNRAYAQQTIELTLDNWPDCLEPIELPRPPLISVESVKYYTTDNAENVWDISQYYVDYDNEPGRISPNYSVIYPSDVLRPINGIKVRYTAGYAPKIINNSDGSTSADYCANVPQTVKQAMLLLIGDWYENRDASMTRAASKDVDFSVKALLGFERVCPT